MKFTNGYWLLKDGVNKISPIQMIDYKIEDRAIVIYASGKEIADRGQTLNDPMLTFYVSSPLPNIVRVRGYHHIGGIDNGPSFEILENDKHKVSIEDTEEVLSLTSGDTTIKIGKNNWNLSFYYKGKPLTQSQKNQLGYIKTADGNFWREQLNLDIGECVYGFGEQFSQYVKNGQTVDIWNEDGGTCSDLAYKNIPFYFTSKGYGVFVNQPEKVSFEVATEVVSKCQFSVQGEKIDYMIIGGDKPKEAIERYTDLTGKPALPPAWSFGLWLSTSFTTNYDENTVNSFIDGMINRDIPLSVFHFDCFWMKEYEWCNFEWDKEVFPDPAGLISRIKAKGIKVCVWINPYIGQKSPLFKEGMDNGYFIKNKDGGVWQWDMWQAGQGIVDFTNPEACKWYTSYLEKLIDMGVDCFKTDFGERIPVDGVYFDGSDPLKMHNYYTYLYNKTVFDLLKEKLGEENAIVFARSATAGSQKFPVHWGGDCESRFESMAETLRGGLSLMSSGFGFWSHDISGFENTAPPEVYKRWVQFGLLSSHSRLHGSNSYRVPWLFDEESVDVVRKFTKLKCRLMPYIYNKAVEANKKGIPVMRSMIMEFPEDRACDYLERQYMFGDSLLIAPIFNFESTVDYYLPRGKWTNILTNEIIEGGSWINEKFDFFTLPLMAKENSIIPIGGKDNTCDYNYLENLQLHIFNLINETNAEINDVQGKTVFKVKAERNENKIMIKLSNNFDGIRIVMRNIHNIKNIQGASIEDSTEGIVLSVFKDAAEVVFEINE
ncbi:glycoside hydrolase family 31 [Clostridium sp. DL-VIII]|uniref:alpha-xylosidase n=1 Tax=Clostridium sp. DL-VIII TaxID=641107 RepID=UPI00023AFA91|nr:alpha-xylosidase [Clostridium sp. DL-VIII]EHI99416.1 glycoside hydrolase family 31 [Clostridium sp. DL-VIII]